MVRNILSAIDADSLPREQQTTLLLIKQLLVDARLDVRDYELSVTRAEQRHKAKEAKRRLYELSQQILLAGQANFFGPVDIAHISAKIEQISDNVV
jgi:hypothetical protein